MMKIPIRLRFILGRLLVAFLWLGGLLESSAQMPDFTLQPSSRTNDAGTSTSFSVSATGAEPLSYRWRKEGVLLANGMSITGAATPTLTISDVLGTNAGRYSVVVSNSMGSVTSAVATLTVLDPVITTQPVSQQRNAGESVSFSVTAAGTLPLAYQWCKDGGPLYRATNTTLTVNYLQGRHAGGYTVVVSNCYGSSTSEVAALTVTDPWIMTQPGSQVKDVGQSATLSVTAAGAAPLRYQWYMNGVVLAQATNASLTFASVQTNDAGSYAVEVTNQYGHAMSVAATLTVNLAILDSAFNPGADGNVHAFAIQADRKILVAGGFITLAGQRRYSLGRLNADGTLDSSFNPAPNNSVYAVALQSDQKIIVGGGFSQLNGTSSSYVGRLNGDGTSDASFKQNANGYVHSLAVQPDGKILMAGGFTMVGGQTRHYLARLNADGSLDTGFNPVADNLVYAVAVQWDEKILLGGDFTAIGSQTRTHLARLNQEGTLDSGFDPGASSTVHTMALQADGRILVGGNFTTLGGQTRHYAGRLDYDGALDDGFNPGPDDLVHALAVQANGQIILGGYFSTVSGQPQKSLARLNADGTLDSGFSPMADDFVIALALQDDGKILVGGGFGTLGGQSRAYLGRVNNTEAATQILSYDGLNITWLRNGSCPEVWSATFDWSTDGSNWTSNAGAPITGGWMLGGQFLSSDTIIRAHGQVTGGRYNGSGWFSESITGPILITAAPLGRTNDFGTTAVFSVAVLGPAPVSYQWFKDGAALTDGGRVSGATTDVLTLTNIFFGDMGGYYVVVSGAEGSVTSAVATLTVNEPIITVQPVSQLRNAAESVTLAVTAAGTAPLRYQWLKNGVGLAQGTNVSLTLHNVQFSDAGNYSVVVSNQYSSVTSAVAMLAVLDPWIKTQPASRQQNPGDNVALSVTPGGSAPFRYQWWKDGLALAEATDATLSLTNLQGSDAGGYTVVVSSQYVSVTSAVALLTVNLITVDGPVNLAANNDVYALAVQADERILVGGHFTALGGQTRNFVGRLNPDGTLDSSFNPAANGNVRSLLVQSDGKIVVGGEFTTLNGQSRSRLGRLNADGTLDGAFNPGAASTVYSLALQADDKILVGGTFGTLGGQSRAFLGRLNADGTLDSAFNPGASSTVYCLAMQADNKILAGGFFGTLGGQSRAFLGRLNADGTLDSAFNPGANSAVFCLVVQGDGKILVGGDFSTLGGQPLARIARLNADGTGDSGFNPGADNPVYSLSVQANGKILAGGYFTTLGGQPRSYLARLNSDGTLDPTFNPSADHTVRSLGLQNDGKILAGGSFATICGQARSHLARLNNTEPATQSLSYDGSTITWLRGGASPEVWRATFDQSGDGLIWGSLGSGQRIAGGWQMGNVILPSNPIIRARGCVCGSALNGSGWFVETLLQAPWAAILTGDGFFGIVSNQFGFNIRGGGAPAVVVEVSSNLIHWTSISTNSLNNGATYFSDPDWTSTPQRFYRCRVSP